MRITKFYTLIGGISLTNQPDMMSLAASGLQPNAIKYYTKVRKVGAAGKEFNKYVIV